MADGMLDKAVALELDIGTGGVQEEILERIRWLARVKYQTLQQLAISLPVQQLGQEMAMHPQPVSC